MEQNVIISIKGTQTSEDGEETVEFVTDGWMEGDAEEGFRVSYQETELTGMSGTVTTFLIKPDRIDMLRSGTLNSEMIFEEGHKHLSLYETPYGAMTIGVNAKRVRSGINGQGGEMDIRYQVELDNTLIGENSFLIRVRQPTASAAV